MTPRAKRVNGPCEANHTFFEIEGACAILQDGALHRCGFAGHVSKGIAGFLTYMRTLIVRVVAACFGIGKIRSVFCMHMWHLRDFEDKHWTGCRSYGCARSILSFSSLANQNICENGFLLGPAPGIPVPATLLLAEFA